jgi:hypothetical protein
MTAPPTTARLVVRRATPATLTGVNGRPTRACALPTDNERPPDWDQSIEPETPETTTATTNSARFNQTLFMTILLFSSIVVFGPEDGSLIHINAPRMFAFAFGRHG